jgi:hypothetical protein
MDRTVYYTLFPYNFYRGKKKIARLSVSEKFINKLRRKYSEIIFEESGIPFEKSYVIYDCNISNIPYGYLMEMLYSWAGGHGRIKKVVSKVEFEVEMEEMNEKINKQQTKK